MEKIKIAGVCRGEKYSPNHVGNDAAILRCVADRLTDMGYDVALYAETDFVKEEIVCRHIFNMARDRATLDYLKHLEGQGCMVVNSAYGIENCFRRKMTEMLIENGVPYPKSHIIDASKKFQLSHFPYWIKRGDAHAMVKEDVTFVRNTSEAEAVLANFRTRGIPYAVVNEHIPGDLLKFYGVAGTGFFYWFYPPETSGKFGLEIVNGPSKGFAFDARHLEFYASKASAALNVPVYGGDCVVSPDGSMTLIDFNDWPSFARCRSEAACNIAKYIDEKIAQKNI